MSNSDKKTGGFERENYDVDNVINGTFGYVWLNDQYMAETTALEAKLKLTKTDVPQCGTLGKGQKITQIERTGTLKMNKVSSYMIKLLLDSVKKGVMPDITIISALKDPAALGHERVKITGVSFDEITLADWEANKLGEESYPFTFANEEMLDEI